MCTYQEYYRMQMFVALTHDLEEGRFDIWGPCGQESLSDKVLARHKSGALEREWKKLARQVAGYQAPSI